MARAVLERELTAPRGDRVQFTVASDADDAEIRRLFRENPMAGQISLSLEREPNYFADARLPGETKQTIVAREDGRVTCAGCCVIRERFVNGQPHRVGYLGGLRLDARQTGRFDIVRRGYEFFRQLQSRRPADFYFTSIAADNQRARKFLERNLPGMPRYEFIGEFVTVLLTTARRTASRVDSEYGALNTDDFITRLNKHNCLYQFSPSWSAGELEALETLGLREQDFRFLVNDGRILAGAALWDQRGYKQVVVRGYTSWLALARPALNFAARVFGGSRLPDMGTVLGNAFVSHLTVGADEPEVLLSLINELRGVAAPRSIGLLTMGFAARDPRLSTVRRKFRCREYLSRLYLVRWPEIGGPASELDSRLLAPEVALL